MKFLATKTFAKSNRVWEDLVSDFLEMACFLKTEEHTCLLTALRAEDIRTENLNVFPCFVIDGHVIVICESLQNDPAPKSGDNQSVWLFYPKRKEIERLEL